jgi:hypothetical protein
MISGVCAGLRGKPWCSARSRCWAGAASSGLHNLIYVPLVEKPGLAERFGADYRRDQQNVPRWMPRRGGTGRFARTTPQLNTAWRWCGSATGSVRIAT